MDKLTAFLHRLDVNITPEHVREVDKALWPAALSQSDMALAAIVLLDNVCTESVLEEIVKLLDRKGLL
jgi:hypothetical protein